MMASINLTKERLEHIYVSENIAPKADNVNIQKIIDVISSLNMRGEAHDWYGHGGSQEFSKASQKIRAICHSFSNALLWFESVPSDYQPRWFYWLVLNYPSHILQGLTSNSRTLEHMIRCFSMLTDRQVSQLLRTPLVTHSTAIIALVLAGFKYERFIKIKKHQNDLVKNKFEQALVYNIAEFLLYEEMIDAMWLLHIAVYHSQIAKDHFRGLSYEQSQDIRENFELLPLSEILDNAPDEVVAGALPLLLCYIAPEKLSSTLAQLPTLQYSHAISKIYSAFCYEEGYSIIYQLHHSFSKKLFLDRACSALHLLSIAEYLMLVSVIHRKFLLTRNDRDIILGLFPDLKWVAIGLQSSTLANILLPSLLIHQGSHLSALGLDSDTISVILDTRTDTAKKEATIAALQRKINLLSSSAPHHNTELITTSYMRHTAETASDDDLLQFFEDFLEQSELATAQEEVSKPSSLQNNLNHSPSSCDFDVLFPYSLPVVFESSSQQQKNCNHQIDATYKGLEESAIEDQEILLFLNAALCGPEQESATPESLKLSRLQDNVTNNTLVWGCDVLPACALPPATTSNSSKPQQQRFNKKRALAEIK